MTLNLPLKKNWGKDIYEISPTLTRQLDEFYTDVANYLTYVVKKNVLDGMDPPANDQRNSFYDIGDIAVRIDTDTAWIMTSRTSPNAVVWTQIT